MSAGALIAVNTHASSRFRPRGVFEAGLQSSSGRPLRLPQLDLVTLRIDDPGETAKYRWLGRWQMEPRCLESLYRIASGSAVVCCAFILDSRRTAGAVPVGAVSGMRFKVIERRSL